MPSFFDAHLHLFDPRFHSARTEVERCAQEANVTACIGCASFPDEWASSPSSKMRVTRAYGIHPWAAEQVTQEVLAQLSEYLEHDSRAIMGEVGVDGLRPVTDGGVAQVRLLETQLSLAARLERPVVLHGARAWPRLFEILTPWAKRLPAVMIHGASFSVEMLRHPIFQSQNIWLSIGGAVVNPNAKRIHALATAIANDRLLIETDAPDLLPFGAPPLTVPFTEHALNHPGNLPLIAQTVADLRGCSVEEIAAQTVENAHHFLNQ